ncbi:hypothetical protein KHA90_09940 [Flavobacterium psychroterrae]|uniref:Uncharacterized protein n=1 Tax=Flavobacterium psychroterrae TaxID=2133767 RepID=A0ABS5PB53_9FLAO|nr:hypothetical protein [Flavobacterium psychroterrae]MBS7231346.1 hypothetical protein [Flavobacterium psychroterrae]
MNIFIIIGIIAFISFTVWLAKQNGITAKYKSDSKLTIISTNPDTPIDFGFKTVWIAVSTDDKIALAEILDLKDTQSSNWKSGLEYAYENSVFITPQIGKWTLAIGNKLPQGDNKASIEKLEKILNKLSTEFGEAQFFGTQRIIEYHNWMKSVNGKMERIYAYIGETGENIKVFGEKTEAENGLNLFNSLSEEAESDSYWQREDLDYADEELVMKVAEKWSVNPIQITERSDVKIELGLVGK